MIVNLRNDFIQKTIFKSWDSREWLESICYHLTSKWCKNIRIWYIKVWVWCVDIVVKTFVDKMTFRDSNEVIRTLKMKWKTTLHEMCYKY